MILDIFRWLGFATLGYFILMQTYLLVMALISSTELRRNHHLRRFGRVGERLSSRMTPPLSIIIPAYNEQAGIADSIRSMSIVKYPRFEIIVVNDGSTDRTLQELIDAFELEKVRIPYRPDLPTEEMRGIYRGRGGVDITVIDKENGGKTDALNAGINAARYPYVLCTDADVILAPDCLAQAMQRVIEDRGRTVCVAGNVRPLNGSEIRLGHLIQARVPEGFVARMQVLEYVRTFLATRPAWSRINGLPLASGAFGIWKKDSVLAIGGFTKDHLGEDLDLTMRMHRYHLENKIPYRIVYEPSAVIWTEVPETLRVLRRQRIRWHRGLMRATRDFMSMTFNPRYRQVGLVTWPGMFLFEYIAPIVEFGGWVILPLGYALGVFSPPLFGWMILLALGMGLLNSFVALLLDESYGYFNSPEDTSRLIVMTLVENLGLRQLTLIWRVTALLGGTGRKSWGNMERRGVRNLAKQH